MIITHRFLGLFDRPFYISSLEVFIRAVCDVDLTFQDVCTIRLFDDFGNLIARAATYDGVNYA